MPGVYPDHEHMCEQGANVVYFLFQGHNLKVQTWDIAHKSGAQIASAYPSV